MNLLVAWIVFAVVLFIAEMLTPSFLLIWFGVGAVGAGIAAYFGLSFGWQWVVFFVVSLLLTGRWRWLQTAFNKQEWIKRRSDTTVDSNSRKVGKCQ